MQRTTILMVTTLLLLMIVAISVWTNILLRKAAATITSTAAPAYFPYPTTPPFGGGNSFVFIIGKPVTIDPNTMVCTNVADLLAFWSTYMRAADVYNDDARRNAVTAALSASCIITQKVVFGTAVYYDGDSTNSPMDFISVRPSDTTTPYFVQAASVNP